MHIYYVITYTCCFENYFWFGKVDNINYRTIAQGSFTTFSCIIYINNNNIINNNLYINKSFEN